MDHVRAIQEVVDIHKEALPVEAVRGLMESAQRLHDIHNGLYKLTWTTVDSHAHVEHVEYDEDIAHATLTHVTQTLIVEAVDDLPSTPHGGRLDETKLPNRGMLLKSWIEVEKPFVIRRLNGALVIVHSIVPYNPGA